MTDASHPDLEALSAALDGEDDAARAHASGCAVCSEDLRRLGSVRDRVAAEPPPLPGEVLDGLVTAAVSAATVTPFSEARRRRPRRPPLAWIAAAAAAIALVAAVPALLGGAGDRDGSDETALATADQEGNDSASSERLSEAPDGGGGAADARGSAEPFVAALAAGDLGDQSDPDELARAVAAALPVPGTATAAAGQAGGRSESAPTTTAPPAAAGPPVAAAAVPAQCEGAAREIGDGRLGMLLYRASARWRGVPAEVLAFGLAPGPGVRSTDRQLYVLSRASCSVLAERRF